MHWTPEAGQTEIWSATLTVGDSGDAGFGFRGTVGMLTDPDFDYRGKSAQFKYVLVRPDGAVTVELLSGSQARFDTDLIGATFHACDAEFAVRSGGGAGTTLFWLDSGLSWKAGDSIAVALTTNVPLAPAAPTVSPVADSKDSLSVRWTAPDNTGRPAIEGYDLRYRKGTSGGWTDLLQNGTGARATITGLDSDSEYQVQVRATNSSGVGDWSAAGGGSTNATAACRWTPASGETVIWSGTLAVGSGEFSNGIATGFLGGYGAAAFGSLPDRTFSYKGRTGSIDHIYTQSGNTQLRIGSDFLDVLTNWKLHLCDQEFDPADGSLLAADGSWTGSVPSWGAGDSFRGGADH